MKKCLVSFYSFSGSTLELALEIADQTGGDIRELIPEKTYALDYNTAAKEIRGEITRVYCPGLDRGNETNDNRRTIPITVQIGGTDGEILIVLGR